MNKLLLAVGALAVGALLVPGDAEAQRSFRGVGIGGIRGGFPGPAIRAGGFPGGGLAIRPGFRAGFGPAAIARPGFGYGWRGPGYYRGYYGRTYPYYGGALAAGVIGGLALGALTYPRYEYAYPYEDVTYDETYGGPVVMPACWQGPPVCTRAGYPNLGYVRRQQSYPF